MMILAMSQILERYESTIPSGGANVVDGRGYGIKDEESSS
jgi:hypothetical protein